MFRFGDAMSIFARSTCAPSGNSPARIRANRSRLSSIGRSRYGLFRARLGQRAAVGANLVGGQAVHVRLVALNQLDRELIELLEVVGREEQRVPLEAEPLDVGLDGVDVLDVFLRGIGVVEPQVARAAALGGDAEIQTDRLRVADVQIPVRLGRKTRGQAAVILSGRQILVDDCADEIDRGPCRLRHGRFVVFRRHALRHFMR